MKMNLSRALFLVFAGVALNGASSLQADDKNQAIQEFRAGCMEATGNEPFCACMANALQKHAPAKHIKAGEEGVEFSKDMPEEAHQNLTKSAKECQEKFNKSADR